MSILVNNVTKLYGPQKALDNVSFNVAAGQVIGFLGPNGAGKSTMMKIIAGYIPATHGTVLVDGLDVTTHPIEVKQRIGYLPEHNPLYLDMYVREYLLFAASLYKLPQPAKKVANMVEMTGLGLEQHKKIGALSKGYRQRVGLAQALIHNPSVLILDEPTSGLDPNQIAEIRNLIAAVGREKTIMLSTHIMQEVEAICANIIIINKGQIVANDKTATIQAQSSQKVVIQLEFNTAIDPTVLSNLPLVIQVKSLTPVSFLIEAQTDIREHLFQWAVTNGVMVLSLQKQEKSLEQVFYDLTR